MAKSAMKSPLFLLALGVGAYWLWKQKTPAAAAPASPYYTPISTTPAGSTSAGWDTSVVVPYRPA